MFPSMIQLKIYGQPSSTYEYVKMMVIKQAEIAGIELNIEEINDIDSIIAEELESIPTIKVNNHIDMRYNQSMDINTFVRELNVTILREENYGQMKKILVPIDFSETSENACAFALGLAKDYNGVLKVMHSFIPKALNMEGAVYIDPEIEKLRRGQLDEFVDKLNENITDDSISAPFIEKEFVIGFAGKEIPSTAKSENNCAIVIGSTGSSGSFKTIFGSISTMIAKDASCPVFIVTPNTTYGHFKKIAYASDDPAIDNQVIGDLANYAKTFNSELILSHVDGEEGSKYLEILKESILRIEPNLNIKIQNIESENIVEGLNHFVEDNDIDLMIITKQKRSFFNSLFHASVTRRMTINTKIPLLVLHR